MRAKHDFALVGSRNHIRAPVRVQKQRPLGVQRAKPSEGPAVSNKNELFLMHLFCGIKELAFSLQVSVIGRVLYMLIALTHLSRRPISGAI